MTTAIKSRELDGTGHCCFFLVWLDSVSRPSMSMYISYQTSFVMCLFLPDMEYLSFCLFLADRQELRMSARNRSVLVIYSISGRSKHTTKLFHLTNVAQ